MSIYPTLRYDDAKAAIEFLTTAFGLTEEHLSVGEDGSVEHAELSWDGGVVLLGSRPSRFDTGKAVLYVPVDEVDAHHDRAVAAGAEVTSELTDQPYGSREYAAVDTEGNRWSFGTYDPLNA